MSKVVRMWHGRVPSIMAAEYTDYLRRTGIPDYRETEGNLDVQLLHRTEGDITHFLIVTLWESLEHIREFAGDDVNRARYYPEDRRFLLELEPEVEHWEVEGEA